MSGFRRLFRWGAALLLAALFLFVAAQPGARAADERWRARYYNNRDVSGDPVFRRDEERIDHDWGDGGPGHGVSSDNFSARWTRMVRFDGGTYRFYATMDDGLRLWVDGRLVLDDWNDSQVRTRTVDLPLTAGDHHLEVHYYEAGGKAVAKLTWALVGGPPVSTGQWRGDYFSNRSLSGGPILSRADDAIDFDWGGGSPGGGVPVDNFSVRWTRTADFNGGTYRFTAVMDDGMRVFVDNRLVIDEWREAPQRTRAVDLTLSPGQHRVEVQYMEVGGQAVARFGWAAAGDSVLPGAAWFGEYYSNQQLSGAPSLTRLDRAVNFNWGSGPPAAGLPSDHFSVRWTRDINASPGRHRLTVSADDGVRVWVNNRLILDEWRDAQNVTFQREVSLPGGVTPLRVEFYEDRGTASVSVSFTYLGTDSQPVPEPQPTPVAPSGQQAVVAYANWLNLRRAPEVADNIITALPRGQVVTLAGRNGPWVLVRIPERRLTGWVSGRYLESSYPISYLPFVSD